MLGSALPLWQAALIGLLGFGLPLLFVAYLRETDAFADLSVGTLVVTAVLGVAFGVGWGIATDVAAARTDDDALGLPVSTARLLITGLAIPLGFLILLLAPMVVVRFWRPGIRESLDGFAIGALGALCFVTAGSLTRLAPQLANGPVDDDGQSPIHLVIAGAIQGVAVPLTAAAVGGAVGATLWFTRRTDAGAQAAVVRVDLPVPAIAFGVALYLGLGCSTLRAAEQRRDRRLRRSRGGGALRPADRRALHPAPRAAGRHQPDDRRCCAHSATTWFRICRSAPAAGSQATPRRERRGGRRSPPGPVRRRRP